MYDIKVSLLQAAGHSRASELRDAVEDAHRMLRSAEGRVATREAALQESEQQLQASRDEAQDLRFKLGSVNSQLKAAVARLEEQAQFSTEEVQGLSSKLQALTGQFKTAQAALQESGQQLQSSRDEAQDLRFKLGSVNSSAQGC